MVSMFSPHFINWTEQLRESEHDIYWFDINGSGVQSNKIEFVNQITNWKYRADYPGRYFIKKEMKILNRWIGFFNERNMAASLDQCIKRIRPDVVHSFVMYLSAAPILKIMLKYSNIKWVYSSWGSDLFYYQNIANERKKIKETLPHLDYLFTDCERDYKIALRLGFTGQFLGVFPGGGGFNLNSRPTDVKDKQKLIAIKGYQGKHGKCINVIKSLYSIKRILKQYKIVIFGAGKEVQEFISTHKESANLDISIKGKIPNNEVLDLFGKSQIYIGNSSSDGIPNTLLEAMLMGAFPIQSNPGGATSEIIKDGFNGFLINSPDNPEEIASIIDKAIANPVLMTSARGYNEKLIQMKMNREFIKDQVLARYNSIQRNLNL